MPSSRSSQTSLPPYPPSYHLTDPPMSTTTTSTQRIGRGGAGNIIRSSPTTTPAVAPPTTLPPLTHTSSHSKPKPTHTGRGGSGNISRIPSEKRLFSFDEELALQLQRSAHPAPIYHVGRGGWANTVKAKPEKVYIDGSSRRRESDGTNSSSASEKSEGSAPRTIIRRIGRTVGKAGDYFVG